MFLNGVEKTNRKLVLKDNNKKKRYGESLCSWIEKLSIMKRQAVYSIVFTLQVNLDFIQI